MPNLDAILAVTLAGLALSLSPGPSMLYVLSRAVGQSRAAGLASALGLCIGGILLAVATAFGLATAFERIPLLVTVLRYAGSAYLVWIGFDMIRSARHGAALKVDNVQPTPLSTIVWQGVIVEALNPKTVLFFALFLPPFIAAPAGPEMASEIRSQLLVLGALVPLTAVPSDIAVALLGGTIARVINREQVFRTALSHMAGLLLIAIALNLHLQVL